MMTSSAANPPSISDPPPPRVIGTPTAAVESVTLLEWAKSIDPFTNLPALLLLLLLLLRLLLLSSLSRLVFSRTPPITTAPPS